MNISPTAILKSSTTNIIGQSILYYQSLPSTMDIAKKLVKDGIAEGTVIVAGEQTGGRGRMGRRWLSPPGTSLSVSIILNPTLPLLPNLNMVASLAVVQSAKRITSLEPVIKWPNDILIKGKKLSGILIETIFEGNELIAAIVGIGINIKLDPSTFPDISDISTSLSIETEREISRRETLKVLLEEFEQLYLELDQGENVYERWVARLETLGKEIQVSWGDTIEIGIAESANKDGSLVLKRKDGSTINIVAGEVTLHK